jgi:hypothetical protein
VIFDLQALPPDIPWGFARETRDIMKPYYLGETMSNGFPIAKLAVQVIASVGVSKVVNDVISNNTNVETTADAVKVATGSIVLGSMIAEQAAKHVNERMDALTAWYLGRKAEVAASQ